jgi:hypothetical protein
MSSVRREMPSSPKPGLADFAALYIRCDDCGNEKRMAPQTLASFAERGIHCADTLRPKLTCTVCRAGGRGGKNVALIPTFRRA